jgi:hypothetical protein
MKCRKGKKAIEAKVRELFPELDKSYNHGEVSISISKDKERVVIEMTTMYDYMELKFSHLKQLSEFLPCKEISDSRTHSDGCETCDYGSSYEITLTCWDFGKEKK